ncbi:MAG: hypothetical protein JSR31_09935 [Nitrospira sp.]|nr:hypothetical protein [Nitrospira sp.]
MRLHGSPLSPAGPSQAKHLSADRGYDADWLIAALKKQDVTPCIPPPRKHRTPRRRYSKSLYKQRFFSFLASSLCRFRHSVYVPSR